MKIKQLILIALCCFTLFSFDDIADNPISRDVLKSKSAQGLVAANNAFAFDFIKAHSHFATEANYMISPVSLSLALGMAYNGAAGDTKKAFEDMMHYNDLPLDINDFNRALIDHLSSSDKVSLMEIANSIWVNEGFPVKNAFLNQNEISYDAEIQNLDFFNPESLDIINGWVSQKTHDKIPTILDSIDPNAVLYLINALYFNAQWKYAFDKEYTKPSSFQKADGTRVSVEKMHVSEHFPYYANESFSSVVLPYANDQYQMTIILPNYPQSTEEIIASIDLEWWNAWQADYDTTYEVTVALPKFKSEYSKKLNDELKFLGIENAFSSQANFSNISDISTFISFVLQKTFIDVNEEGTEAAAVTVIGFEYTSIEQPPLINFDVDRPFLYFITDQATGAICFMGKVGEPVL